MTEQAGSKFQGVSPVERKEAKEDRNVEKGEFSVACKIEKRTVREENEIEPLRRMRKTQLCLRQLLYNFSLNRVVNVCNYICHPT